MRFSDIAGHERVKNVLMRSARDGHIGHAYIFEGCEGVGRLTAAKTFAQLLVCESPVDGEPCGRCKNCSMANSGNHSDIRIITNQVYDSSQKSTNILVDTVRHMKSEIYIKPYSAERKIYIMPKADTMNLYAQNSLLKVLEEPPEYCTIILIAENSNMFLPTILSRAVIIKFNPLETELVRRYVQERFSSLSAEEALVKACMSGGSIGTAIRLAENGEADELRAEVIKSIVALADGDRRAIYDMTIFLKQNKADIDFVINIMRDFFRDLLHVKNGREEAVMNADKTAELKKICGYISNKTPLGLLETIVKYTEYFSKNISYALTVQCMAMELWEVIHDRGYRS